MYEMNSENDNVICTARYLSPCGALLLGSLGDRLCLCSWMANDRTCTMLRQLGHKFDATISDEGGTTTDMAARQLDEYFVGRRTTFDVPLLFCGTPFQQKAWQTLMEIPYGTTVSYTEMARRMGMPKAVRAAASANHANRLSIFAPCHRVIGVGNKLVGYAGGLAAKRYLLDLESAKNIMSSDVLPDFHR